MARAVLPVEGQGSDPLRLFAPRAFAPSIAIESAVVPGIGSPTTAGAKRAASERVMKIGRTICARTISAGCWAVQPWFCFP